MKQLLRCSRLALSLALAALVCAGCTRNARRDRMTRHADADFAAGNYGAAEVEYRNVLQLVNMDPHAILHLGLIFAKEGRPAEAYAFLKKAEELRPKSDEVKTSLASVYLGARDGANALREAKEALGLNPTNGEAMLLLSDSSVTEQDRRNSEAFLHALPGHPDALSDYHIALAEFRLKTHDQSAAESESRLALASNSKSAEAHYLAAQLFFQQTNVLQGSNELRLAVSLAPWRSPIRLREADVEFETRQTNQARATLEEITQHAPDYVPAWTSLMHLDFKLKQFEECQKAIATILGEDPKNFEANLEAGLIDFEQKDYAGAFKVFDQMATRFPTNPEVRYELGVASAALGEGAKAGAYYAQAIDLNTNFTQAILSLAQLEAGSGNSTDAIRRLNQLLHRAPTLAPARLLLADVYLARRDTANAVAQYDDLLKLRPSDPRIPYLMGLAFLQAGDLPQAQQCFSKASELTPDAAAPLERLVDVEVAMKKFDAALQLVQQRIDKDPKQGWPWFLKGQIERRQDQASRAEADLNQAIKTDPSLVQAYVALADLYVAQHQEQQAIQELQAVISRTNNVAAFMTLGAIQQHLNHPDAARSTYEKLLAFSPKFAPALNDLAYLDSQIPGQLDKALKYAQQAHDLRPNDPYADDTLGWILYQHGDYDHALLLLRQSAEGEPGEPEVQFHLGMANYMLGNEPAASVALNTAASSSADFPGKDQARQRLAVIAINPQTADATALARLQRVVKSDPNDPIAASRLAEADEHRGSFDQAAEGYKRCLKSTPLDVAVMVRWANLDADHLHQPDDALALAKKAYGLEPDNPQACALLGRLSYDHGDYSTALAVLRKAAAASSPSPRLSYDLARANYAAGRLSDAETYTQQAITGGASADWAPEARQFLVLVQAAQTPSAAEAALPQAQAILQKDPNSVPALMVCAAASEAKHDYSQAASLYQKAAATIPDFPLAARQLALLYADHLSDDAQALSWGEKARQANLRDPQLNQAMGVAAYRHAQYTRSAEFLRESAQTADTAPLQFYLGMDYLQLKQLRDGKAALQRALAMNLPSNLATEARDALAKIK